VGLMLHRQDFFQDRGIDFVPALAFIGVEYQGRAVGPLDDPFGDAAEEHFFDPLGAVGGHDDHSGILIRDISHNGVGYVAGQHFAAAVAGKQA
jgi:hypothetical protein